MTWSKYNNPNRKRKRKKPLYSNEYIEERKKELMELLTDAKTDKERQYLIEAYRITINP